MDVSEDIRVLSQEIKRISEAKFTGSVKINLAFNQGGIGKIQLVIERNLKGSTKKS